MLSLSVTCRADATLVVAIAAALLSEGAAIDVKLQSRKLLATREPVLAQADNKALEANAPNGSMGALEIIFNAVRREKFFKSDIFISVKRGFDSVQHRDFM